MPGDPLTFVNKNEIKLYKTCIKPRLYSCSRRVTTVASPVTLPETTVYLEKHAQAFGAGAHTFPGVLLQSGALQGSTEGATVLNY